MPTYLQIYFFFLQNADNPDEIDIDDDDDDDDGDDSAENSGDEEMEIAPVGLQKQAVPSQVFGSLKKTNDDDDEDD